MKYHQTVILIGVFILSSSYSRLGFSGPVVDLLKPGDRIEITITDLASPGTETLKRCKLSEAGNIALPLVGQVDASGKSLGELERAIEDAYRGRFIKNPTVKVVRKDIVTSAAEGADDSRTKQSGVYYVGGAVSRVGVYAKSEKQITLKEAIASAGGIDRNGIESRFIRLTRTTNDKPQVLSFEIGELMDGWVNDIYLHPEDQVMVGEAAPTTGPAADLGPLPEVEPVSGKYFIKGKVNKPGAYEMTNAKRVSLLNALVAAGVDVKANANENVKVIAGDSEQTVFHTTVEELFDKTKPNILLSFGDQVTVGDDTAAKP